MNKTCKQCQTEFDISSCDLEFYRKISPTFDGKTFEIPAPSLCYECRLQRRLMRRNERVLYKRTCELCDKSVISVFAENSSIKVLCNKCWWSDDWSPFDYGVIYDETKPFFEQFDELYRRVPQIALQNDDGAGSVNCEYCPDFAYGKNCYLMAGCWRAEDCMYGLRCDRSKNVVDSDLVIDSQYCYECTSSTNLYNCYYVELSDASRDCYLSYDLLGCHDCIECYGLRNKSYWIKNEPSTKEAVEARRAEIFATRETLDKAIRDFEDWSLKKPKKFANMVMCDNCTGHIIRNCKNSHAYLTYNAQDCKFMNNGDSPLSCYDVYQSGKPELCYEGITPDESYLAHFTAFCWRSRNLLYSDNCVSLNNSFGCTGFKRGQYVILNKQYTKEEYEKLSAKIIERMIERGEWGEFFPIEIAPFAYNEAIARDFFPLSREEALKLGAKWQDTDYSGFSGEFYEPKKTIDEYIGNEEEQRKLLGGAIKCKASGKPFRVIASELAFYMEHKLPLPEKCFDERIKDRLKKVYKLKLYPGKCMNEGCENAFTTIYGPNNPEIVYCADCYEKSMI